MAEQHGDQLTPASHAFGVLLTTMTGDCFVKYAAGYQTHDLTEYAAYSFHGRVVPPVGFVLQLNSTGVSPPVIPYTPVTWLSNVLDRSVPAHTRKDERNLSVRHMFPMRST
jgi:hypothetical protein